MAYFIFTKNLDDVEGTLYRIAENQSDLNNLNIIQSNYKIIEVNEDNKNLLAEFIKDIKSDTFRYFNKRNEK